MNEPTDAEIAAMEADAIAVMDARAATCGGDWKVFPGERVLNDLGREKGFKSTSERPDHHCMIGTASDHPQLGGPAPIVTIAVSPFFDPTHVVSLERPDAEFMVAAKNHPTDAHCLIMADEVRRLRAREAELMEDAGQFVEAARILCFDPDADARRRNLADCADDWEAR